MINSELFVIDLFDGRVLSSLAIEVDRFVVALWIVGGEEEDMVFQRPNDLDGRVQRA